jgi:hypothetical protein
LLRLEGDLRLLEIGIGEQFADLLILGKLFQVRFDLLLSLGSDLFSPQYNDDAK